MAGQELTLGVETHCNVLRSGWLWPHSQILDYPEAGLLTKSSFLAAALGGTKFITFTAMNLVILCCAT